MGRGHPGALLVRQHRRLDRWDVGVRRRVVPLLTRPRIDSLGEGSPRSAATLRVSSSPVDALDDDVVEPEGAKPVPAVPYSRIVLGREQEHGAGLPGASRSSNIRPRPPRARRRAGRSIPPRTSNVRARPDRAVSPRNSRQRIARDLDEVLGSREQERALLHVCRGACVSGAKCSPSAGADLEGPRVGAPRPAEPVSASCAAAAARDGRAARMAGDGAPPSGMRVRPSTPCGSWGTYLELHRAAEAAASRHRVRAGSRAGSRSAMLGRRVSGPPDERDRVATLSGPRLDERLARVAVQRRDAVAWVEHDHDRTAARGARERDRTVRRADRVAGGSANVNTACVLAGACSPNGRMSAPS